MKANKRNAPGPTAARVLLSGSAGGAFAGDLNISLDRESPLVVEMKRRGSGRGFATIARWLDGRDLLSFAKIARTSGLMQRGGSEDNSMKSEARHVYRRSGEKLTQLQAFAYDKLAAGDVIVTTHLPDGRIEHTLASGYRIHAETFRKLDALNFLECQSDGLLPEVSQTYRLRLNRFRPT